MWGDLILWQAAAVIQVRDDGIQAGAPPGLADSHCKPLP